MSFLTTHARLILLLHVPLLLSQLLTVFGSEVGLKRLRGGSSEGAGDRRLSPVSCDFGTGPDAYVSLQGTDDAAAGSSEVPYKTIQYAVDQHTGTCASRQSVLDL